MTHPLGDIVCFWVEPVARLGVFHARHIRYDKSKEACPACTPYVHNGHVQIGEEDCAIEPFGSTSVRVTGAEAAVLGAWPAQAKCGYVFEDDDAYEIERVQLYRRPDLPGEKPRALEDWGVGRLFDAWWMGEHGMGPDKIRLGVETPAGTWYPDQKGHSWNRAGDPRVAGSLTISPSILFPTDGFHAHLVAGVLVRTPDSKI